jgi:hypothetical protein
MRFHGFLEVSPLSSPVPVLAANQKRTKGVFIGIAPTPQVKRVYHELPEISDVTTLPYSVERGTLVRKLEKMDELRMELESVPSLFVTMAELETIKKLAGGPEILNAAKLIYMLDERIPNREKHRAVISFLTKFWKLRFNAWWRITDVRTNTEVLGNMHDLSDIVSCDLFPSLEVVLGKEKDSITV